MINRNKALLWVYDNPKMTNIINDIYDSVGSCVKCHWWREFEGVCTNGDSPCCASFVDGNYYCGDFEEKKDVNKKKSN